MAEALSAEATRESSAAELGRAVNAAQRVMGALSGVVVADFSRVLAAPYATMLMADLGADVIKVEHPERGDDTSSWGPPFAADEATYFLSVNRNKRSLGLDLSQAEGRRQARELASSADVVVENFRPGTMAKYGLSYADIRELNPRVVYCSITGFGSGAGAPLPGYDLLVQAVGGLMSVTGSAPGGYTLASAVPGILGNRHSSIAPYEVFATSDGPIVLAVGNDRQFAALCRGLGVDGLAQDSRFVTNPQRVANVDELAELLSEQLAQRTAKEWFEVLTPLGVPCGPVNDLAGAFDLAERLGLRPRARVETEVDVEVAGGALELVANPISLSGTPPGYRARPPRLGEHTEEISRWLNRPRTELDGSN